MPVIIPEAPEDTFGPDDWVEVLASAKPGGAAGFSLQSSQDSLVLTVPGNKVRSAILEILGYSEADVAAPWRLRRPAVPMQHPRFPWLFADGISVQFTGPLGNTTFPYDTRRDERYTGGAARTQSYFQAKEDSVNMGIDGYSPTYMGRYARAEITVRFGQVDWLMLKDGDPIWENPANGYGPDIEYNRFFGLSSFDPKLDLITAEGGTDASSFYFSETDDPTASDSPNLTTGPAFNGSVHVRRAQSDIEMCWHSVAEDYTCVGGPIMPQPKRLLAHLGTTNDDWFPYSETSALTPEEQGAYPPHTLLFNGLKGRRYQLPARTESIFNLGAYNWDWYLQFVHFDPNRPTAVKNKDGVPIAEESRARGWRLQPHRHSRRWFGATAGDATTRGTPAGNYPLMSTSFQDMFKHVSDTGVPYP